MEVRWRTAASATSVYGLVTLLCIVCYWNSLDGDFVHDDIVAIVRNPDVQGTTDVSGLLRNDFWGKPMCDPASHKSYRPLTTLTFRLNRWLSGVGPRGYHLVNILLHTFASLQFAFLCRRHLAWDWENTLASAILFATHPIHTEAVSSIVGRAEVLSAIFFLLGLSVFLSDLSAIPRLVLTCVCAYFALSAKEQGITLLVVCIAYYFIQDTRFERKRRKKIFADRELLMLVSALAFGIGCRVLVLQGSVPQFSEQDNPASHNPVLLTRVLTYFHLPAANLWLLLCPLTLSYDWQLGSVPLVTSLRDPRNLHSLVTYCMLAGLFYRVWTLPKWKDKVRVYFGLGILVLPFLPASNLVLPVGFVVAERVLYIPSLGFCILVVEGVKRSNIRSPYVLWTVRTTTVLLVLFFCLRTLRRNHDWLSRETLFRSGLKSSPQNAKIHYNFANLQKDKGNKELAIAHYKRAISLWPNYASAHNNLGTLLSNQEEAERHFRSALWIAPDHARAHYNLAALYRSRGQTELAVWLLNRAVTFDTELEDAFALLATIYTETGHKSANHSMSATSRPESAKANQTATQKTLLYHVTVDRET